MSMSEMIRSSVVQPRGSVPSRTERSADVAPCTVSVFIVRYPARCSTISTMRRMGGWSSMINTRYGLLVEMRSGVAWREAGVGGHSRNGGDSHGCSSCSSAPSKAGKNTLQQVPLPTSESMCNRPWKRVMTPCTVASPRPLLSTPRVEKKGSKALSNTSLGIPQPLSDTSNPTHNPSDASSEPLSTRHRMRMTPVWPLVNAFLELVTRFTTVCSRSTTFMRILEVSECSGVGSRTSLTSAGSERCSIFDIFWTWSCKSITCVLTTPVLLNAMSCIVSRAAISPACCAALMLSSISGFADKKDLPSSQRCERLA
mmetsp:Transcript_6708/g.14820  ORF Transcript_6708/g.14820 Transcript_6708/m.14820 type:complete len:313 (+) Transcript_6708:1587-2525(+)